MLKKCTVFLRFVHQDFGSIIGMLPIAWQSIGVLKDLEYQIGTMFYFIPPQFENFSIKYIFLLNF